MKARRSLIALALLAVYLLMTAGTAAASLSCECLASPVRAAHLCNHGCPVSGAEPVADGMFGGVCCDDLHSTDIELYLSASDDAGKCVRCVVTDLPPPWQRVRSRRICRRCGPLRPSVGRPS